MNKKAIEPSGSELDLSKAAEVEERLQLAVEKMRAQAKQLQEKKLAREELTPEDKYHMQGLFEKMKAVEQKQKKLKEVVDADLRKKEAVRSEEAEQRMQAMKVTREKPPAKLRMHELRDMNQIELTEDDREKRYKDANTPQKIIPSGGLIGFSVAPDLLTKDYDSHEPAPPNPWDGSNRDD